MTRRAPSRSAHRNRLAVRRVSVAGLLAVLTFGLTGCGDPDGGGGGGGGYVVQQATFAPSAH